MMPHLGGGRFPSQGDISRVARIAKLAANGKCVNGWAGGEFSPQKMISVSPKRTNVVPLFMFNQQGTVDCKRFTAFGFTDAPVSTYDPAVVE
jgi:hypothetical protein